MAMTIDQRLEKLTERHEALTQTVELMVMEMKEREQRLDRQIGQIVEGVTKLLHVAEIHEHRISDLEGGTR